MVKISISKGSWEFFYIGKDEKVGEAEFTRDELHLIREAESLFWATQQILDRKVRRSKEGANK